MKIIKTYKLKRLIYILIFLIILILLLTFSKENFLSVKKTTTTFFSSVLPSLFPFILFTEILLNCNILDSVSNYLGKITSKIFKTSRSSTPSIIIGFLCGFPMGATSVINALKKNKIDRTQAEKLLMFVNNCNPAFILSTIGIGVFLNLRIGLLLLISHYLSAIILGIIFSKKTFYNIIHKNDKNLNRYEKNIHNLDKIEENLTFFDSVKSAIVKAFFTLDIIFGFMIIFNLIFSQIETLLTSININKNILHILSGIFEMTQGSINVFSSDFSICSKIYLISFILSFSGLCVISQIYSVISKYKFSFKNLFISKLLHGIFSTIITYILIKFTNIIDINTISVFESVENQINLDTNYMIANIKISYLISTISIILLLFLYYIIRNIYLRKVAH